jgi:hypothetical protein
MLEWFFKGHNSLKVFQLKFYVGAIILQHKIMEFITCEN